MICSSGSVPVLDAFERLVRRGTEVHLVPGNRDALIGAWFEKRTGGRLHPDGFVGEMEGGECAVFVHGDALCTRDTGYLRLRSLWRFWPVRLISWLAPMWFARRVGSRLRGISESTKPIKLAEEKAIQRDAHDVRDESLGEGLDPVRWIVVGAWEWEQDLLRIGEAGSLQLGSWATIGDR